jgi:hypothetical protein
MKEFNNHDLAGTEKKSHSEGNFGGDLESEYLLFLESDSGKEQSPQSELPSNFITIDLPVTKIIRKDLVHSPLQIAARYSVFSVIGYLVSLAVCAQNTLGLSPVSLKVAEFLHTLPEPLCPILCGAVFTGVPFLLTCLFLNRFQQRYLLFKMWGFLASVPIIATVSMFFLPHQLQHTKLAAAASIQGHVLSDASWMAFWAASAILVPYLLEGIIYLMVRPRRAKSSTSSTRNWSQLRIDP